MSWMNNSAFYPIFLLLQTQDHDVHDEQYPRPKNRTFCFSTSPHPRRLQRLYPRPHTHDVRRDFIHVPTPTTFAENGNRLIFSALQLHDVCRELPIRAEQEKTVGKKDLTRVLAHSLSTITHCRPGRHASPTSRRTSPPRQIVCLCPRQYVVANCQRRAPPTPGINEARLLSEGGHFGASSSNCNPPPPGHFGASSSNCNPVCKCADCQRAEGFLLVSKERTHARKVGLLRACTKAK